MQAGTIRDFSARCEVMSTRKDGTSTEQGMTGEYIYCGRQVTAGEGITKKNSGRRDKVSSLCGVRFRNN
jgi:hypothetical protein